jgi:hypothetical protein
MNTKDAVVHMPSRRGQRKAARIYMVNSTRCVPDALENRMTYAEPYQKLGCHQNIREITIL